MKDCQIKKQNQIRIDSHGLPIVDNIETTPQEQDNLQADTFPIFKFGPRPDNWNEYLSQKIAWTFAPSPGLGPDSYIKKAKREYALERERERERKRD